MTRELNSKLKVNYFIFNVVQFMISFPYILASYRFLIVDCFSRLGFLSDVNVLQVDLTEYVEKHEFVFDAVLNEEVSNDEVCCI